MCIVSYRGATGISRHPARPSDPRKPARRSSEECVSASLSVSLLVGSHLHRLRNSRGSRCGQFYTVVAVGGPGTPMDWRALGGGARGAAGPRLAGQRSPGLPGRSARGRAYASKGSGVRRAHHTSRHSPLLPLAPRSRTYHSHRDIAKARQGEHNGPGLSTTMAACATHAPRTR